MRRLVAVMILAGALAACGQAQMSTSEEAAAPAEAYGGMADMDRAQSADLAAITPEAAPAPPPPPGQPPGPTPTGGTTSPTLFLAYSYALGLEVPSQRLAAVMDTHIQACTAAGPRLCQLVGSNKNGDPDSAMNGFVSMRGEPAWLRTFMGGMEALVDQAGGRIVSQSTNTEDLTRAIVDTEARLRAQTTLRDRLQELLRSRPGRLADLIEVERELARVQAEIDAVQSNLAVMRTRVSMSELTVQYSSEPRSVGSDTFLPLREALSSFLGIIVMGFAAIITIIAGLIPFAIVLVPLGWLLMRWRRQRGGHIFRRAPKPETPANS